MLFYTTVQNLLDNCIKVVVSELLFQSESQMEVLKLHLYKNFVKYKKMKIRNHFCYVPQFFMKFEFLVCISLMYN